MNKKLKVAIFFGTRPEAIKMFPVVHAAKASSHLETVVINTGQHKEMCHSVLQRFNIVPEHDFAVMQPGQTLNLLTQNLLKKCDTFFKSYKPDVVLVHGDTTTAFAVSLAAFYEQIPVGHVEAGLRTFDFKAPFPEEMNRAYVDLIANWCFAPTELSKNNLLKAGVSKEHVFVTGNTVIDAVQLMSKDLNNKNYSPAVLDTLNSKNKTNVLNSNFVLITAHRRESFGQPMLNISNAFAHLARSNPELSFIYPVHPNPNVKDLMEKQLKGIPNIELLPPQDYEPFIWLMQRCLLLLTDSGGLQEECTALGKRCIILRENTERPEVLDSGWGFLAGTDETKIIQLTTQLLSTAASNIPKSNPFGDGTSAQQIIKILTKH